MTPKKLFFVMLIALLGTVALTMGGIYLADKYLGEQSTTIGDLRADDELLSTELINAQQTRESLQEYSYLNAVTDEILPDSKNQSEVILLINKIGSEVGVNIDGFLFLGTDGKPSEKSQTEPLEGAPSILVFPVQIRFNSTYSQLINWLKLAEQNQRKMQVSEIAVGTAQNVDGAASSLLQTTMTINAYLEK